MSFFNRFRAQSHVEDELTLAELTIPIATVDFTEVLEEVWAWLVNDTYKPLLSKLRICHPEREFVSR